MAPACELIDFFFKLHFAARLQIGDRKIAGHAIWAMGPTPVQITLNQKSRSAIILHRATYCRVISCFSAFNIQ